MDLTLWRESEHFEHFFSNIGSNGTISGVSSRNPPPLVKRISKSYFGGPQILKKLFRGSQILKSYFGGPDSEKVISGPQILKNDFGGLRSLFREF